MTDNLIKDCFGGLKLFLLFVAIVVVFYFVTSLLLPAHIMVTLVDVDGGVLPTQFTETFKVYLVQFPDENEPEYTTSIGVTPGSGYQDVPNGAYNLRVYYDPSAVPGDDGHLLYDEPIFLPGYKHASKRIQLNNVDILYDIRITPLEPEEEVKPRAKVFIQGLPY